LFDLDCFFAHGSSSYKQGIYTILKQSLLQIQAHISPDRKLHTPDEQICLMTCSNNQLYLLIERAWTKRLHITACKRKGFFQQPLIDWKLTLSYLSKLNYLDAACIRIFLSFGYLTGEQSYKWKGSKLCPACKSENDSTEHRLRCTAATTLNNEHSQIIQWVENQPLITRRCGLVPMLPFLCQFTEYVNSIELPRPAPIPCDSDNPVIVFTDGTASQSKYPFLRLSAGAAYNVQTGRSIFLFQTPGVTQTVPRAELLAVYLTMSCCRFARIYCDNKVVVEGYAKLRTCPESFLKVAENADVWKRILSLLPDADFSRYELIKVKSHLQLTSMSSSYLHWCKRNNDFVDMLAKQANLDRPAHILRELDVSISFLDNQSKMFEQFYSFLAKQNIFFSRFTKENTSTSSVDSDILPSEVPTGIPSQFYQLVLPQAAELKPAFGFNYVFLQRLIIYLKSLKWKDPPLPALEMANRCHSMSIIEFTIDFIVSTQTLPPFKYVLPDKSVLFLLADIDDRVKYLSHTLKSATTIMGDALIAISQIWGQECLPGIVTRNPRGGSLRHAWACRPGKNDFIVRPLCSCPLYLSASQVQSIVYHLKTAIEPAYILKQPTPVIDGEPHSSLRSSFLEIDKQVGPTYWQADWFRKKQRKLRGQSALKYFSSKEQRLITPHTVLQC
jgi:hypothetical protein